MSLETLKPKVAKLIEKAQSGGGGLPDWDDDSPIIVSGKAYSSTNVHWEVTEKGTFRWIIDYPSANTRDNLGLYCSGTAVGIIMGIRPEIMPFLPKIRQVYVPDGIIQTEFHYMVNCERVRLPDTLVEKPSIAALPNLREMDMSGDIYATLNDYRCSNMYGLEKVILSPLTTIIPRSCFAACYSLKEINLENVTVFKDRAFHEAFGLSNPIVFNEGLTSIASTAFYRTGLTSITFQTPTTGAYPTIANNAFGQCFLLKDIYVPWAEGEVANAPWGATNATIHYNSEV